MPGIRETHARAEFHIVGRAPTPAVTWTTMPPAKSMTPAAASAPPPQMRWHAG